MSELCDATRLNCRCGRRPSHKMPHDCFDRNGCGATWDEMMSYKPPPRPVHQPAPPWWERAELWLRHRLHRRPTPGGRP
jgi:hypothetical protein